jgi:hypothetical protein
MKKVFAVLVFGLVTATASSVFAQEAADSTTYNFEDDLVQGDLVRPDGENLIVRKKGAHQSLIRIREHFVPEMLKSVEDL